MKTNLDDYLFITKDSRKGTRWEGREPVEDFVVGNLKVGGNPGDLNQHGYLNQLCVYEISARRKSGSLREYEIVEEGSNYLLGMPDNAFPFWDSRKVGTTRFTRKARKIVEQKLRSVAYKYARDHGLAVVDSYAALKLNERLHDRLPKISSES